MAAITAATGGTELATAYVNIVSSARGLGDDVVKQAGAAGDEGGKQYSDGFGKHIKGIAATLGGLFVAGKVKDFVTESIQSLARIETFNTQTQQVIESTGGAAGVTADHIFDLTGNLENLTATEAETIQGGANFLLTFTNIKNGVGDGNQVFDDTVKIMTDMSRATGSDMKSSALQLGKALNDPIKGITALSRVGVAFTEEQKEQIKTLQESGDTMGAQKIILAELNKEFGGSAEAYAGTAQGAYDLLWHAIGTFGEAATSALLEPLGNLARMGADAFNWAAEFISTSHELPAALQPVAAVFGQVSAAVAAVSVPWDAWSGEAYAAAAASNPFVEMFGQVRFAAQDTKAAIKTMFTGEITDEWSRDLSEVPFLDFFVGVHTAAVDTGAALKTVFTGDFDPSQWGSDVSEDSPIVDFLFDLRELGGEAAGTFADSVGPIIGAVGETLGQIWAVVGPALVSVWETLQPALAQVLPLVAQILPLFNPVSLLFHALLPVLPAIAEVFAELAKVLADVLVQAFAAVTPLIEAMLGILGELLPVFTELIASLLPPIADLFGMLAPLISDVLNAVMPLVSALIASLVPAFESLVPIIKSLVPLFPQIAQTVGQIAAVLGAGLVQAITAVTPLLTTVVSVVAQLLPFFAQLVASLLPPLVSLFGQVAPLLSSILGVLLPVVDAIVAALIPAINGLMPVVQTVFGAIADIINGVMTVISGVIDFITGVFTGNWSQAWDGIKSIFTGAWDVIVGYVTYVWELISGVFEAALTFVTELMSGVWDSISGTVTSVWDEITGFLSGVWDGIKSTAQGAFDLVKSYIIDPLQAAWTWIQDTLGGIGEWFGGIWQTIVDVTHTILDPIADVFEGIFGGIKTAVAGVINGVIAIVNGVIGGVNTVIDGVNWVNPFDDIPHIPEIGYLAKGGPLVPGLPTVVGEEGPELITWRGSRAMVHSNPETSRMLATATPAIGGDGADAPTGPLIGAVYTSPWQSTGEIAADLDRRRRFGRVKRG